MSDPRPTVQVLCCPVCGQDEVGRPFGPTGSHYVDHHRTARCKGTPVPVEYVLAADAAVPDLLGFSETADLLGVRTSNLRKIVGLPKPVAQLRSGPVWRAADIREFQLNGNGQPEPQWTKDTIVEAIHRFERRNGRRPTSLDFNPADAKAKGHPERAAHFAEAGDYPHVATVQKVYGKWSAALEAAVV